jgi:chromosome segregation ATPase
VSILSKLFGPSSKDLLRAENTISLQEAVIENLREEVRDLNAKLQEAMDARDHHEQTIKTMIEIKNKMQRDSFRLQKDVVDADVELEQTQAKVRELEAQLGEEKRKDD